MTTLLTREGKMQEKPKRVGFTVRDAYDEDAVSNFIALCKEEHLMGSGIVKAYMRLYVEEHYIKQNLLEKARLVPVYNRNYDRNDEA
tara:strand:+ start:149 stop:409 length:261 start_codon:yes stop_codon:yes gene_type:complete